MIEPEETVDSAETCMAEILDLLGWKFARTSSKAPPFSESFDVLEVTMDLSKMQKGQVILQNKKTRVESL